MPTKSLESIPVESNGSVVEAVQLVEEYKDYLSSMIGSDEFYEEVGWNEMTIFNTAASIGLIKKVGDDWSLKRVLHYRSQGIDWWAENEDEEQEGAWNATQFFHSGDWVVISYETLQKQLG